MTKPNSTQEKEIPLNPPPEENPSNQEMSSFSSLATIKEEELLS
jgi:hypothetical protein